MSTCWVIWCVDMLGDMVGDMVCRYVGRYGVSIWFVDMVCWYGVSIFLGNDVGTKYVVKHKSEGKILNSIIMRFSFIIITTNCF